MIKLWALEDYISFLKHTNPLVRRWAFETLESRFKDRFFLETADLINMHLVFTNASLNIRTPMSALIAQGHWVY